MDPIAFTIELTGEAVELGEGRFWAETRGDDTAFGSNQALCRRDLRLDEDGSVAQSGEISFGDDDAITFRAHGRLGSSPDPRLRHGAAVFEVTGGRGRLEGACGFVTSNFLLTADGELTDRHLAVLFVGEGFDRKEDPCVSS